MREQLLQTPDAIFEKPLQQPIEVWMQAIEEAIQAQKLFAQHVQHQVIARAQQDEMRVQQAEGKARQAEEKAQQAEVRARQVEEKARQAGDQLKAVLGSRSWRMTEPLRLVGKVLRWLVRGSVAWLTFAPTSRPRRAARQAAIDLKMFFYMHPRLKRCALQCLTPFPGLKARLKRVGSLPSEILESSINRGESLCVGGLGHLSPRARRIYHDLKSAIEQHQKEQV
jgi:O-antigen chain-terminating methyltransferase